jgi:hypothetical protein
VKLTGVSACSPGSLWCRVTILSQHGSCHASLRHAVNAKRTGFASTVTTTWLELIDGLAVFNSERRNSSATRYNVMNLRRTLKQTSSRCPSAYRLSPSLFIVSHRQLIIVLYPQVVRFYLDMHNTQLNDCIVETRVSTNYLPSENKRVPSSLILNRPISSLHLNALALYLIDRNLRQLSTFVHGPTPLILVTAHLAHLSTI